MKTKQQIKNGVWARDRDLELKDMHNYKHSLAGLFIESCCSTKPGRKKKKEIFHDAF